MGEGERHSVKDGCRGLGPELGTALLRKAESSCSGGGRERSHHRACALVGGFCVTGKMGDWGRGETVSLYRAGRGPGLRELLNHPLPRGLSGRSSKRLLPHPSLTRAAPGWQRQCFYGRRSANCAPSFLPPLSAPPLQQPTSCSF